MRATGPTPKRLALAERARTIRDRQPTPTWEQVAVELGVSRTYAQALYDDPDGRKARARKDSYAGVCEACGAATSGSDGRALAPRLCATCAAAENHENRYYTREKIIEMFQEFHRLTGRVPGVADRIGVLPSQRARLSAERIAESETAPHLPHPAVVHREFGSWPDALVASGFEPRGGGSPHHRGKRTLTKAATETLRLLEQNPLTLSALAKARNVERTAARSVLALLEREGLVTRARTQRQPGQKGHPPYLYSLVHPLHLNGKEKLVARTYAVLQVIDDGSRYLMLDEAVEAVTPDMAIEKAADEAGLYVAVPSTQFVARHVGEVTRLAVLSDNGASA